MSKMIRSINRYHDTFIDTLSEWWPFLLVGVVIVGHIGLTAYVSFTDTAENRVERKKAEICLDTCELQCLEDTDDG